MLASRQSHTIRHDISVNKTNGKSSIGFESIQPGNRGAPVNSYTADATDRSHADIIYKNKLKLKQDHMNPGEVVSCQL